MERITKSDWDEFLKKYPDAHILQTSQWGDLKAKHGWIPHYICDGNSGAQILFRKLPFGLTIGYIPKGPVGNNWQSVLDFAIEISHESNAIVLYIEPDLWIDQIDAWKGVLNDFQESKISIQPKRTIAISLIGTEDDWLKEMKQKTRYNIRLAAKKDIVVERSEDIELFNQLMRVTSNRDEFNVHQPTYYSDVFNLFSKNSQCELLIAKYENTPLASLMVFFRGNRAWYFYGASNNKERNRMPTYLLQWEAMRLAAARGCATYDLWGIPDCDYKELETKFMGRSDGLWGVYRFKRGFGGEIKRTAGVYEKALNRILFTGYKALLKLRKSSMA